MTDNKSNRHSSGNSGNRQSRKPSDNHKRDNVSRQRSPYAAYSGGGNRRTKSRRSRALQAPREKPVIPLKAEAEAQEEDRPEKQIRRQSILLLTRRADRQGKSLKIKRRRWQKKLRQ